MTAQFLKVHRNTSCKNHGHVSIIHLNSGDRPIDQMIHVKIVAIPLSFIQCIGLS
jgi:hypothetical protein